MVWFQCESCGDNLKKPKLQSHFQQCAAHRLSCIDCGVVFDRQSVQGHTSCVTEEVRYGPRDAFRQALANPSDGSKEAAANPEENLELTIGLSTRPPWGCSLCRVKCTSQETLQGHAQGKKHRAKARAAAKAQLETEGGEKGVSGESEKKDAEAKTRGRGEEGTAVGVEKAPEGAVSNGKPEPERTSKKKRKDRDSGAGDVKVEETPVMVEPKKGENQRKEAADAGQQAEMGVEEVETVVDEQPKKEKKKGKKAKAGAGLDVTDVATDLAAEGGQTAAGNDGAVEAGAEGSGGVTSKKGKKRKNGDAVEAAGHTKQEGPSSEEENAEPEAKRKKGKAGKVLDVKQYWAELAETGRRKKQEEALAGGDEERERDGTAANDDLVQPAPEEAPRKKKRKGALKNEAEADVGKLAGAGSKDGDEAKSAEKGPEVGGVEVVKPGKLRKMMQAALQEAPKHSLSVKKLVQSVLTQPSMDVVAKDALRQQILLESATSSKFRIEGGKVSITDGS